MGKDTAFLKALEPTLTEWNSENDNEDYLLLGNEKEA